MKSLNFFPVHPPYESAQNHPQTKVDLQIETLYPLKIPPGEHQKHLGGPHQGQKTKGPLAQPPNFLHHQSEKSQKPPGPLQIKIRPLPSTSIQLDEPPFR